MRSHAVYAEAQPVLYSSNIFSLTSPLVLLYLKDYVLRPQHFAQIRHVQLFPWVYFSNPAQHVGRIHEPYDSQTWPRFWSVVAEMRLSRLGLWLEYWGKVDDCTVASDWIKPAFMVSGVEEVGIHIQHRVTAWKWERMHKLEEALEKTWTNPRHEGG